MIFIDIYPGVKFPDDIDCSSLNLADDSLTYWVSALAAMFLLGFALHLFGSSRLSTRQEFSLSFLAIYFNKYTSLHCFTYSDLTQASIAHVLLAFSIISFQSILFWAVILFWTILFLKYLLFCTIWLNWFLEITTLSPEIWKQLYYAFSFSEPTSPPNIWIKYSGASAQGSICSLVKAAELYKAHDLWWLEICKHQWNLVNILWIRGYSEPLTG